MALRYNATTSSFQSTPPARGATKFVFTRSRGILISIHAPREGGDADDILANIIDPPISIHAPREGGDGFDSGKMTPRDDFNPRPPRGGRLVRITFLVFCTLISIHAPREGGNSLLWWTSCPACYFNPRPPRGGRQKARRGNEGADRFQSTPPARGATVLLCVPPAGTLFQSTPPARGATISFLLSMIPSYISIHAPREGGDFINKPHILVDNNFNPRPPRGGRPGPARQPRQERDFNPRPPRGGRPGTGGAGQAQGHFNPRPPRGGRPPGTAA